jgi:hypothetical protein
VGLFIIRVINPLLKWGKLNKSQTVTGTDSETGIKVRNCTNIARTLKRHILMKSNRKRRTCMNKSDGLKGPCSSPEETGD